MKNQQINNRRKRQQLINHNRKAFNFMSPYNFVLCYLGNNKLLAVKCIHIVNTTITTTTVTTKVIKATIKSSNLKFHTVDVCFCFYLFFFLLVFKVYLNFQNTFQQQTHTQTN